MYSPSSIPHTDFPGRINKFRRTLIKVQALVIANQPPAARRAEAATLCQPGAKLNSSFDRQDWVSFKKSMAIEKSATK
jgi:hypothetical protein